MRSKMFRDATDEITAQKAQIAELEEALRPFTFRDNITEEIPPDAFGHYELFVEAEDVRRVRKVLDHE